ncbi:MAG TPA: HAMP domain-containing sensor histidine kinase [Vicinamibacteria bacterium]
MAESRALCMPLTGLVPGQVPAEVVAIVAHDLRTPLNAISMGASLLDDATQPEQQKTLMLEIIRRAAHRMDRLIADLLEAGRIDAGRTLKIAPGPVDLAAVVEQVSAEVDAGSRAKGQTLECALPDDLPPVLADRTRLAQVLANLIANAAKFTPKGGRIRVTAAREGDCVRVAVSDSGPGLGPEDLLHVFEPFWQAQMTASLGCGLGLKIARAIVEAQGGRMWVESEPGQGATFAFTVPVA